MDLGGESWLVRVEVHPAASASSPAVFHQRRNARLIRGGAFLFRRHVGPADFGCIWYLGSGPSNAFCSSSLTHWGTSRSTPSSQQRPAEEVPRSGSECNVGYLAVAEAEIPQLLRIVVRH